jgi:hypothetical protein
MVSPDLYWCLLQTGSWRFHILKLLFFLDLVFEIIFQITIFQHITIYLVKKSPLCMSPDFTTRAEQAIQIHNQSPCKERSNLTIKNKSNK